jgi:hypothetical protein
MNLRLVVFLPLLAVLPATAQFQKGDRMLGATVGSVNFNSGTGTQDVASIGSADSKSSGYSVQINPSMGWFINEKTVVGAALTLNPSGNKVTYESGGSTFQKDQQNSFNIGAGGFVRHYLAGSGRLLPFAQLGLNAGVNTSTTEGFFYGGSGSTAYKDTYDGKSSGGSYLNAQLLGGFSKMVGDLTALDFYIGYNFSRTKSTFSLTRLRDEGNNGSIEIRSENETTSSYTNHGVVLGVGFQVFLRSKKK